MLNINDIQNLLNILARSEFKGIDEAEVAVVLKQKLMKMGQAEQQKRIDAEVEKKQAQEEETPDGGDASTAD